MRRKTEATRQRIIDAAYECFWRAGYTRTSLDTIAVRAGVTKRTVYSYFRSKDDLLAAVLAHYNDTCRAKAQADRRPHAEGSRRHDRIRSSASLPAGRARRRAGRVRVSRGLWSSLPICPAIRRARSRAAPRATTESWLAGRLARRRVAEPRERAREIMLLLEGAMALTLIHGHRRYIDAASRAAQAAYRCTCKAVKSSLV